MINNLRISDCFTGLVGWKESAKAPDCFEKLTDELKRSDSGEYVNTVPGMSLEIINDIKGKDQLDVNTYLADTYEASVLEMMNKFIQKEKKAVYTKSLLKNQEIGVFNRNPRELGPKNARFVGYEIVPKRSNSIRAEVLQLGGMFSKIQDDLPIYFYSQFQLDPIAVLYTDIDKAYSLNWFNLRYGTDSASTHEDNPLTFIADYINNTHGHGARYWLGYYEADLDDDNYAILTEVPCSTCNSSEAFDFNQYVGVSPVEVSAGNTYSSRELFNTDQVGYSSTTYGLFIKVNATCDVSQVICENKTLFATSLKKAIAVKFFWDAYNAPASAMNSNSATLKSNFRLMAEKLEIEVYGGIVDGRYQKGELDTLTIDFSNIDQICLGSRKGSLGVFDL